MVSKSPDMVMKDMDFTTIFDQDQPKRIANDTEQLNKAAKEVLKMEVQLELNAQENGGANLYSFFLQAVPRWLLIVFLILLGTVAFIERSPRE